jgi:hypothetical protein
MKLTIYEVFLITIKGLDARRHKSTVQGARLTAKGKKCSKRRLRRNKKKVYGIGFKVWASHHIVNFTQIVMTLGHKPYTVSRKPFCYLYAASLSRASRSNERSDRGQRRPSMLLRAMSLSNGR